MVIKKSYVTTLTPLYDIWPFKPSIEVTLSRKYAISGYPAKHKLRVILKRNGPRKTNALKNLLKVTV